jgi:arabinofuranan 3-O-arabinosyltransferase
MSRRLRRLGQGGLDAAALLAIWAVALSVPPPGISADTKLDLYVDPWGFLARALHLWDPQVTWGVLQNQGYGYLFPMGPFFAVTTSVLPVWVAQRLWWGLVLSAAYGGMRWLLRAMDLPRGGVSPSVWERAGVLASLAYAFAPRMLTTVGGLSSETLPVAMAPWIMAPLVLADRGRLTPRRAACLSALGVLGCGGINATATVLAAVPAAVFVLTRRRWWSHSLAWWTAAAGLAASAWWLGPLLVLGRFSPPFLDWIEDSRTVTGPVGLLDVARGTTHWLARLGTPRGAWWPVGFEIATSVTMLVVTGAVAACALAGLSMRELPHRGALLTTMVLGVVLLAVPHVAPLGSPLGAAARDLLDGPLAALRNVHKADPLVRLPLTLALAQALGAAGQWWSRRGVAWRRGGWGAAGAIVLALAAPALTQGIAVPGAFDRIPTQWVEAGRWLDAHRTDGPALVVPASNVGDYRWGRPLDEPIRPLTDQPYAVRDSVPLTPAGTIRFLDDIETRLQRGRDLGGAVAALRAQGTRYLVLRNDLDAASVGQPPVALARSAIRASSGVQFAAGFGTSFLDAGGVRVQPVEVYDLGQAAAMAQVWPVAAVTGASGASEALSDLRESGVGGPVVFDGDAVEGLTLATHVSTDSNRARERFFGVTRGRDVSSTLTARDDVGVDDYRVGDPSARSTLEVSGPTGVTASSSLGTEAGILGLWPNHGPAAAVDGLESSAWVTGFDDHPTLTLRMGQEWRGGEISVTPYVDEHVFGELFARATTIEARTEAGVTRLEPSEGGFTGTLAGPTRWVELEVAEAEGKKLSTVVTGLAEVRLAGLPSTVGVHLPDTRPADAVVLSGGRPGTDGCLVGETRRCLAGELRPAEEKVMRRSFGPLTDGQVVLSGTATLDPQVAPALDDTLTARVTTSSSSTPAWTGGPVALVDGDADTQWSPAIDDRFPSLSLTLPAPQRVERLHLGSARPWPAAIPVYAEVTVGGRTQTVAITPSGEVELDPAEGAEVGIRFLRAPNDSARRLAITEVTVNGMPWTAPRVMVDPACGGGPSVTVDGVTVPTRISVPPGSAPGDALAWEACGAVTVAPAASHDLVVDPGRGYRILRAVVRSVSMSQVTPMAETVAIEHDGPTRLVGEVSASPQSRIVSLAMNSNPGWQATLGGRALSPVVLDGFRQGFVIPAATGGRLDVRFAPDGTYRWVLLGGGVLALPVLLGAAWPGRRRTGAPLGSAPVTTAPRAVTVAVAGLAGGVLLGIPGLAVGVVAALAADRAGRAPQPWGRVLPPVLLLLTAVALQAVVSQATAGPVWLEATSRVLVLGSGTYAAVAGRRARGQVET